MTGEIELGKDIEVTFNYVNYIGKGSHFSCPEYSSIESSSLQKPESLIDDFYIDECTARSNQSGEFKLLVQNSCTVKKMEENFSSSSLPLMKLSVTVDTLSFNRITVLFV